MSKLKSVLRKIAVVAAVLAALTGPAAAGPSEPTVQNGQVIIKPGGNTWIIEQLSNKAIVDWRTFNINANEVVRFLQPGRLSVILNRVTGGNPSVILGQLNATGQVFLLNPNGILFGPGSQVNTGGFLASTLKMTNDDFLNGRYNLAQDPGMPLASVINQGTITVTEGGYAVLAAPLVSNEGVIVANMGKVVLGAGERVTLNFDGYNLVNWSIPGLTGAPGTVVVPQAAMSGLLAQVIQNHNVVEAGQMVSNADGTFSLHGASGLAINNGVIHADGVAGGNAGSVTLQSVQATVVGPQSVITANGEGANSNGGQIRVLSDMERGITVTSPGSQLATHPGAGGQGGLIETSAHTVWLRGSVDPGQGGNYLIDPAYLTIVSGGGGTLDAALPGAGNNTTGLGGLVESVSQNYLQSVAAGTVTLQADNTITINDISNNLINMQSGVNLVFATTTGNLIFSDPSDVVQVNGTGAITANIGQDLILGKFVATGSGAITLNVGRNVINNGSGANLTGDNLVLNGNLGSAGTPIAVAGVANPAHPAQIHLNLANNTQNIYLSANGGADTLSFLGVAGASSSAGWLGNSNLYFTKAAGNITLNTIYGTNVNVTATAGSILGPGVVSATQAVTLLAQTGTIGTAGTHVHVTTPTLTAQTNGNAQGMWVDDTSVMTTLNVLTNGGAVTVTGGGGSTLGYAANTLNMAMPATNVNFTNQGAQTITLNTIQAQKLTVSAATNIAYAGPLTGLNVADLTLILRNANGSIGTALAPILLDPTAGGANTTVAAQVNNGQIFLQAAGTTETVTLTGAPLTLSTTALLANTIENVTITNTGNTAITLGQVGSDGNGFQNFNFTTAGDIVNGLAPGVVNLYAVNTILGGRNIGTSANHILTLITGNLVVRSTLSAFIDNPTSALARFQITGAGDGSITALNGFLSVVGGVVNATVTDADVGVEMTAGNLTIATVTVTGTAAADYTVTMITDNGSILQGAGTGITIAPAAGQHGNVTLSATGGNVGSAGTPIQVSADGVLTVQNLSTGNTIRVNDALDPTRLLIETVNGTFHVTTASSVADLTAGTLTANTAAAVTDLVVRNIATNNINVGVINAGGNDVRLESNGSFLDGNGVGVNNVTANNLTLVANGSAKMDVRLAGLLNAGDVTNGNRVNDLEIQSDQSLHAGTLMTGATTVLTTTGATSDIILGSLAAPDPARAIDATGTVTLVTARNILDGNADVTADNVIANNLVMTANNGHIGTDGATDNPLEIRVNNLTVNNNGGSALVSNGGAMTSVTLNRQGNGVVDIVTTPGGGDFHINAANTLTATGSPTIGTITVNGQGATDLTIGTANLGGSTVNLNFANAHIQGDGLGGILTAQNATLTTQAIGTTNPVGTSVSGTLTLDTHAVAGGDIHVVNTGNPANLVIDQKNADVDVQWTARNLTYTGQTTSLLQVAGAGPNPTNLIFRERGTSTDVNLNGVDLGLANVTIQALSTGSRIQQSGGTLIATNATLSADSDIGSLANPIIANVSNTLTATSTTGSVYLDNSGAPIVNHVIITTPGDDYSVVFRDEAGVTHTASFTAGVLNVTGTVDGTDLTFHNTSTNVATWDIILQTIDLSITTHSTTFMEVISDHGNILDPTGTSNILASRIRLQGGSIGDATHPIHTAAATSMCIISQEAGGSINIDNGAVDPAFVYLSTNNGTVHATWNSADGDYINLDASHLLTGHAAAENIYLTNTNGSVQFDNSLGTAYTATGGLLVVRTQGGTIQGGTNVGNADVNLGSGTLDLISSKVGGTGGSIGNIEPVKVQGPNMTINAYTIGGTSANDRINLQGMGDITFNQIYAGSTVTGPDPIFVAGVGCVVQPVVGTPGQSAGSIILTGNGNITIHDAVAGTGSQGDGDIGVVSTGGGNIFIYGDKANQSPNGTKGLIANSDTITIITTNGGSILDGDAGQGTGDANITANTLSINTSGRGDVGQNTGPCTFQYLITAANNIGMTVGDGGAYVHAIGSTMWGYDASHPLTITSTSTTQNLVLLNEGTSIARDIHTIGSVANGNVNVRIMTLNGADIVLGNVVAEDSSGLGSTVSVIASGGISNGMGSNPLPITPAPTGTYNVDATKVLLIANKPIGAAETGTGDTTHQIYINATDLAATTTSGGIYVRDHRAMNVTQVTDPICGIATASGVTAPGNVQLRTESGDITITKSISGDTVCLHAGTGAGLGNILDNSGGTITDVTGATAVGLEAHGTVGTLATPILINTPRVSASAQGVLRIRDLQGFTVGDYCGLTGVSSTDLVCMLAPGTITINSNVISTGGHVNIQTTGATSDIILNTGDVRATGAGQQVSLDAGRNITNPGGTGNRTIYGDTIILFGNNVGVTGGNPIKVQAGTAGNPFVVSAGSRGGTGQVNVRGMSGNMTLQDGTTVHCDGSAGSAVTLTGSDLCYTSAGSLTINNAVGSATTSTIGISAATDLTLQAGVSVTASSTTGKASLEAGRTGAGAIVNNSGLAPTVTANTVVLKTQGSDLVMGIAAANLAASSTGNVRIQDTLAVTVLDSTLVCSGTAVNGVSSGGSICLVDTTGSISLNSAVTTSDVNGSVGLWANTDINLNNSNVHAGLTGGTASLVANTGAITGGNGIVSGQKAALLANGTIGSPIKIDVAIVGAQSTTGAIRLVDQSGNLQIGSVDTRDTSGCGGATSVTLDGVRAVTDACVTTPGNLDVTNAVRGDRINLEAGGNITLGATQTLGSAGTTQVGLNAGTAGSGSIVNNTGAVGAVVTATTVILKSQGASPAGDIALWISSPNLAASAGGSLHIRNDQSFTVTTATTLCSGTVVTGATAGSDICLVSTIGSISLNNDVFTTGANASVALSAVTDINLNNHTVAAGTTGGTASLVAQTGAIAGGGTSLVQGNRVAIDANGAIGGAGSCLRIDAARVGATSHTAGVFLADQDVVNPGLIVDSVATVSTLTCGGVAAVTLDGLQAAGNVGLISTGAAGSITLNQNVSTSDVNGNVTLSSKGAINLNGHDVNAGTTGGQASLVSQNGSISGGTGVVHGNLVGLQANGNIGVSGTALRIDAATVGATSTTGSVFLDDRDLAGSGLVVGTVTTPDTTACGGAAAITLNGVHAATDVCVNTQGDLTISQNVSGATVSLMSATGAVTENAAVTATTKASIEAVNSITGSGTIAANTVVLRNTAATADIIFHGVQAPNVAVQAGHDARISDNQSFTVVQATTLCLNNTVTGVTSTNDVCLVSTGANASITLNENVSTSSANGNVGVYAKGSVNLNGHNVQAGTTGGEASVVSEGGSISGGTGVVQGNLVALLANGNIGVSGTALRIDAATVAATSTTGSVFLDDRDLVGTGLVVGTVSTLNTSGCGGAVPVTLNGVTAATDVCVNTVGDLTVSQNVGGANVSLMSSAGGVTENAAVTATNKASIEAINSITGTGTINANTVVLRNTSATGDIIFHGLQAPNVAVQAGRTARISDNQSFTVVQDTTLCLGNTVTGVTSTGDICLVSTGASASITLNQDVSTSNANGNVGVYAKGNVDLNGHNVKAGTTGGEASVVSEGGSIAGGTGVVQGNLVALLANGNIGVSGTAVRIDAATVAATSTTGSVFLDDRDLVGTGLVVGTVSTLNTSGCGGAAPVTLNGVTAATDVCVNTQGDLTVSQNVGGANVSLMSATGAVTENAAVTATNKASIEAINSITGTGTINANTVVLRNTSATGDIIFHGLQAPNVAVQAGRAARISDNQSFTVVQDTTLCLGNTVTGVTSTGDICLVSTGANASITLNQDVSTSNANGNVGVYAKGDVNLNGHNVKAGTTGGEASVVSEGGSIAGGTGVVQGNLVALLANGNIGVSGTAVRIDAATVAATSTTGSVYLDDRDLVGSGLVVGTVSTLNTSGCGGAAPVTLNGVTAATDVCVNTQGDLTVSQNVGGANVSLMSATGAVTENAAVTATNKASIEAINSITGTGTINANTVVLRNTSATGDIIFHGLQAPNVAVQAGRTARISDNQSFTVVQDTTLCLGNTVTGVTSTGDICLVSTGANASITLDQDVSTSNANGNVGVYAKGNVDLNGHNVKAGTTGGEASVVSEGGSIAGGTGVVQGNLVALLANGNIGVSGTALRIDAATVAATSTTGSVFLDDRDLVGSGLVVGTVSTLNTSGCGGAAPVTLNGVTAATDVCVNTVGDLTVSQNVSGANVSLMTSAGGVTENAAVTATNKASIEAVNSITGSGTINANTVVLRNTAATGDIIFHGLQAPNVAVQAGRDARISDNQSFAVVQATTLCLGNTVTGISSTNNICITAPVAGSTITLNQDVATSNPNGNIGIYADGTINLNTGSVKAGTTGGEASLVSNTGAITDVSGVVQGSKVALLANGTIGAPGARVIIDTALVAAQSATGNVLLVDQDLGGVNPGLVIGTVSTLDQTACGGPASVTLNGVTAAATVCVTTQGDMTVSQNVQGASAGLRSVNGDVTLNANLTATGAAGTASIEANGSITGTGIITGANVGLIGTTGNVGTPANAITLQALVPGGTLTLAGRAGGIFRYYSPDNVTVGTVTTVCTQTTISGITANIMCQTTVGDLILNGPVSGQSYGLHSLLGNVILNSTLTATDPNGTASVQAAGSISGNGLVTGNTVVLIADNGSVGAFGSPINVAANILTAQGQTGIYVYDPNGFTIGQGTTVCVPHVSISGVTSLGDVCLGAATGDIIVGQAVSGANVGISALGGSVVLNNTITSTDRLTITAANDITGNSTLTANRLGLVSTTGSVGSTSSPLSIQTNTLAGSAANLFRVVDPDGFTVGSFNTVCTNTPLTGVTASTVCLRATTGLVTVDNNLVGTIVSVVADNIVLNSGGALANAGNGTASLVANHGSITSTGVNAVDVSGQNMVMTAAGSIGSRTNPLHTHGSNLAAQATSGSVFVSNSGPLTITELTTSCQPGSTTVNGVSAGTDVCIGSDGITVARPVVAVNNLGLRSTADIAILETGSVTAGNAASLNAIGGSITGNNGAYADVTAPDVVLTAGVDVGVYGSAGIGIDATRLAVQAGGDIAITSLGVNGVALASLEQICTGNQIDGLDAAGRINLLVTQGNLELTTSHSGGSTNMIVTTGSILDGTHGGQTNVTAGGPSVLRACNGTVGIVGDPIKVQITGNLSVGGKLIRLAGTVTGDILILCTPDLSNAGTFNGDRLTQRKNVTSQQGTRVILQMNAALSQDDVNMGVNSFYLNNLLDIIVLDPAGRVQVNLDSVDQINDLEFMLKKEIK